MYLSYQQHEPSDSSEMLINIIMNMPHLNQSPIEINITRHRYRHLNISSSNVNCCQLKHVYLNYQQLEPSDSSENGEC